MSEFIARLTSSDLTQLLGMALVIVSVLVAGSLSMWFRYRKAELRIQLKQQMLDRGMSAEEIKAVLDAGEKK